MMDIRAPRRFRDLDSDEYEEDWVRLFDPGSTSLEKRARYKELERGIVKAQTGEYKDASYKRIYGNAVPKDTIVALVMTGGYECKDVLNSLHSAGVVSGKFVMIGYSSGAGDKRHFSDGNSMVGTVYIPSKDLQVLKDNLKRPLLLLDNCISSGLTVSAIGNALKKQLGYEGQIYQCESGSPVYEWNGAVRDSGSFVPYIRDNPPIVTERDFKRNGLHMIDIAATVASLVRAI